MHAQPLVADTQPVRSQLHILQCSRIFQREREILLDQSRLLLRSRNLVRAQPCQPDKSRIVYDLLELSHRFQEARSHFPVHLLRHDKPTAERRKIALHPCPFLRCFRQEQVTRMIEERTLVEVHLVTAGEETKVVLVRLRLVILLDEPVLLVNHRVVRQHLYSLRPSRMNRFIFGSSHREQFRQLHPEGDSNIRILADDAVLFHREQWELAFYRGSF